MAHSARMKQSSNVCPGAIEFGRHPEGRGRPNDLPHTRERVRLDCQMSTRLPSTRTKEAAMWMCWFPFALLP